ncbi:hypothetical protein [Paenibacillus bouchesdurhonensis]|uniref:hypothetical protein n=1 Tax=Paenibacillus bouchesdurhonensis TaxID=1870990 RepID=UPI00190109C3|nr:hypothetical protein [Paenibacillus bouchesdurhonensis]
MRIGKQFLQPGKHAEISIGVRAASNGRGSWRSALGTLELDALEYLTIWMIYQT